jgi:hypothetical protein
MNDTVDSDPLNVTNQLNLPPDPPESEWTIPLVGVQPAPVITTADVVKQVVPTVHVDDKGVPHVTIPLTKKTKAYIGTGVALVSTAGVIAAQMLPQDSGVVSWIQVGIGAIGLAATYLGIVLPTNLPIKIKK